MPIQIQRLLPLFVSILILIAVFILRQYSKTFAAILATMPINIPLALWVTFGTETSSQQDIVSFTETLLVGLPPTFVFIIVTWLAARAGWALVPIIAAGYVAWGVSLGLGLLVRGLLMR